MDITKYLSFALLATMPLLLAACDRPPQQWKKPNMTALSPRLQPMFDKTKTVCFGRFMVEVPASTTVVWGGADIPLGVNIYPKRIEEVKAMEQKFINELKSEKAIYLHDIPLLISVESFSEPEGQIVTGYDGFEAVGTLKINGYFKINNDGVVIDARPLMEEKDETIADIKSIARRLRLRAENEIPTDPGNCIEYAFLPDDPRQPKDPPTELISIGFRLKEFPDTHLSIQIRPSNPHYSESDSLEWQLERHEKNLKAENPNHPMLKTVYFRRGSRQIHDWVNGFEGLSRSPEQPEVHSVHDFAIAFRGVAGDYLKPFADIRMQTGVSDNVIGTSKASLTDEEAIAVWDKITSTIRVRPTSITPVKSADAGPRLPLAELAATGRICPQTGWWISDDESLIRGGGRQHIKKGEPMPHVVTQGEPSLWQKLKGEQPTYRTATVWKLAAYGDAPAPESSNIAATNGSANDEASPDKKG